MKITREQKITLWRVLSAGQWLNKRDIVRLTDLPGRAIRAICAEEPDKFLSSQRGYLRTDFATDEEINTAIADLRSRMKCLSERSEALERVLDERNQKQAVLI